MRKLSIADATLKELNSSALLFREKIAVAECIDNFGADYLELPQIKNIKEDSIIYKTIAQSVKESGIVLNAGTETESIEVAYEAIKAAKKPCLQIELPVSAAQMEYQYALKDAGMLDKITNLVKTASEKCTTQFSAKYASAADIDFLVKAAKTAAEAGAACVCLCDTDGIMIPEDVAAMVEAVKAAVSIPVIVKANNRISLACANAIAAVKAGASGIITSIDGENVLTTASFAAAIKETAEKIGVECNLNQTKIQSDIKSILAQISKDYQPAPGSFGSGAADKDVFLDSDSTIDDVKAAATNLGYDLSDIDAGNVHEALKLICEKKSSVGAKELEAIIASSAMQVPSTYHLEGYMITNSSVSGSMARITLSKDGEKTEGMATGDGPIDAAFRAIEQTIGHHYQLDEFQIQAVTEGKESLGATLVKLASNGKLYSGNGLSPDIVGACIRAYINALNKIVYEEQQ